jgi:hypothetical protein
VRSLVVGILLLALLGSVVSAVEGCSAPGDIAQSPPTQESPAATASVSVTIQTTAEPEPHRTLSQGEWEAIASQIEDRIEQATGCEGLIEVLSTEKKDERLARDEGAVEVALTVTVREDLKASLASQAVAECIRQDGMDTQERGWLQGEPRDFVQMRWIERWASGWRLRRPGSTEAPPAGGAEHYFSDPTLNR